MNDWTKLVKKMYEKNKHKAGYMLGDAMKDAKKARAAMAMKKGHKGHKGGKKGAALMPALVGADFNVDESLQADGPGGVDKMGAQELSRGGLEKAMKQLVGGRKTAKKSRKAKKSHKKSRKAHKKSRKGRK